MKASTTPFVIPSANSIINGPYPITALQFAPLLVSLLCPPLRAQEHIVVSLSGLLQTFNFSSLRGVQPHLDTYLQAMKNVHAYRLHRRRALYLFQMQSS